jgi:hypothetical protein
MNNKEIKDIKDNKNDKETKKGNVFIHKQSAKSKVIKPIEGAMALDLRENLIFDPRFLKNENDQILENFKNFLKVFSKTYEPSGERYYKYVSGEVHLMNNVIQKAYWKWRNEGLNLQYYVKHPMGPANKDKYQYVLHEVKDGKMLDNRSPQLIYEGKTYEVLTLITGYTKSFYPEYAKIIRNMPEFKALKEKLNSGIDIHIYDVEAHGNTKNNILKCIKDNKMIVNKDNILEMLNNKIIPSNGLSLAIALLDLDDTLFKVEG